MTKAAVTAEAAAVWVHRGALKPWAKNPRLNDGQPVETVALSMKRFGFGAPIVARKANSEIIAGHTRLKGVDLLLQWWAEATDKDKKNKKRWHPEAVRVVTTGMVPVRFLDLSATEAHLLALADNPKDNDNYAKWDEPALMEVVAEFEPLDLQLVGWDEGELEAIADGLGGGPPPPVDPPTPDPPKDPVTKLGDVWVLGDHRLACGDCREVTAAAFQGASAQMVFTDPPWGVDYSGGTTERERLEGDKNTDLYLVACEVARDFSDDDCPFYLWHAGVKGIAAAAAAAALAAGWEIRCQIIWNKNLAQFGALTAQYKAKHEPAYYCHKKGKAPRWFGPTNEVTVWDIDRAPVNEFHPTQKPVELAVRAMKNSSERGDLVGDFFLGSGATMMAAEQLGRRCFGTELSPAYCDVIVERWEELTGGKAVRA